MKHAETRTVPYTPEQMFALVADVERYPEFLPWVIGARVNRRNDTQLTAELIVGFKMIRESYVSQVTLTPHHQVDVAYERGPFKRLTNQWKFSEVEEGCRIEFFLDFEFRSRLLQRLIGGLFNEAVRKMVGAFETRARKLYGKPGTLPDATGEPA